MKNKFNLFAFLACLLIVSLALLFGNIFTSKNVNSAWYQSIKPSITPPNWVFGPVWIALFFLIALSLYYAWANSKKKDKSKVALLFSINLILNALWSFFFFQLKNPLLAFVEIILLWFSILAMIVILKKIDKTSSFLLIPYIIWITIAAVLNFLSI